MFYLAIYIFPLIAIFAGVVSLISLFRFVKQLYSDSKVETSSDTSK